MGVKNKKTSVFKILLTIQAAVAALAEGFISGVALSITFAGRFFFGLPVENFWSIFCGISSGLIEIEVYREFSVKGGNTLFLKGFFKDFKSYLLRKHVFKAQRKLLEKAWGDEIFKEILKGWIARYKQNKSIPYQAMVWLYYYEKSEQVKVEVDSVYESLKKGTRVFSLLKEEGGQALKERLDLLIMDYYNDKGQDQARSVFNKKQKTAEEELLLQRISEVEQTHRVKFNALAAIGVVSSGFGFIYAVSFGCLAYTHVTSALFHIASALFNTTALPVFLTVGIIPILAGLLAVLGGMANGLFYVTMFKKLIVGGQFWKSILSIKKAILSPLTFTYNKKEYQFDGMVVQALKGAIILAVLLGMLTVISLVFLGQLGAFINAMCSVLGQIVQCFTELTPCIQTVTETISIGLVMSSGILTVFIYYVVYAWKALKAMVSPLYGAISNPQSTIEKIKMWYRENNQDGLFFLKLPGYVLGFLVALVGLISHAVSEAAVSGEGVLTATEIFSDIFVRFSSFINKIFHVFISAKIWATFSQFFTEFFCDFPFIMTNDGHNHGVLDLIKNAVMKAPPEIYKRFELKENKSARIDQCKAHYASFWNDSEGIEEPPSTNYNNLQSK